MNNYIVKTFMIKNSANNEKKTVAVCMDKDTTDSQIELILDQSGPSKLKKIVNISIQAQPGLKFYINDNTNPIIIGPNGLFSWEIKTPNTYIYSLKINSDAQINPLSIIIITYEYKKE